MFTPEGTEVPEGFAYVDIGKAALGVCWLYGKEYELYGNEMACSRRRHRKIWSHKRPDK